MMTVSGRNVSWTGLARSATSDTRRTASVARLAGSAALHPNSAGNLASYLMNSPPISRAVSRRPPPSKLIIPSAGRRPPAPGSANEIVTGTPGPIVLAMSASVLAGTSAEAWMPSSDGSQPMRATLSRYRSVAATVNEFPSKSRQTAVSIASVSSRLADGTTCAAATDSAPPSTVPTVLGSSGSFGYSSRASETRANSALPQVSMIMSAADVTSTMAGGRLLVISASSLPGTSAMPGSPTSAGITTLADTS